VSMIFELPVFVVLHGACALVYAVLAALVLVRPPLSRTGAWLALACLATAAWAAAVAASWQMPLGPLPAWLEVARSAAWYGFILHLYRRTIGSKDQLWPAFRTMGLLALLVLCGTPLLDWLSGASTETLPSLGIAIRLGFAVCNVLLLENLYFNTPPDSRWNINLLCIALGGIFVYDRLCPRPWCKNLRLHYALRRFGRVCQSAIAGKLTGVSWLRGAMVSSVM
jgi:hypothetical protein